MALDDWFEILDKQDMFGQSILNVYHVQRASAGFNAVTILDAFENTVLTPLLPLQDAALSHTILEARNLGDVTDFATLVPSPAVGTRTGDPFAQFTAAAVQFNRTRTDMKNGQKRFCAGVETDSAGQSWVAAFVTLMQSLGDDMIGNWVTAAAPSTPVCNFGIIKRVCTVEPPPTPCPSYRLPETDLELQFYIPTVALARGNKRSQVSRKVL